jgi:hypothetical protein
VTLPDDRPPLLHERLYLHQLGVLPEPFPERLFVRRARALCLHEEPCELACVGQRWGDRRRRAPLVRAMDMDPLCHQGARAGEALLLDLAP